MEKGTDSVLGHDVNRGGSLLEKGTDRGLVENASRGGCSWRRAPKRREEARCNWAQGGVSGVRGRDNERNVLQTCSRMDR